MRKSILLAAVLSVFLLTGCGDEEGMTPQTGTAGEETHGEAQSENVGKSPLTGEALEAYIEDTKERADEIRTYLEEGALTQREMNEASEQLYKLWEGAMNELLLALKTTLPEEEFAQLQTGQNAWVQEKELLLEEAGRQVEGGSVYPLEINMTAAEITRERVRELYELLR